MKKAARKALIEFQVGDNPSLDDLIEESYFETLDILCLDVEEEYQTQEEIDWDKRMNEEIYE